MGTALRGAHTPFTTKLLIHEARCGSNGATYDTAYSTEGSASLVEVPTRPDPQMGVRTAYKIRKLVLLREDSVTQYARAVAVSHADREPLSSYY